MNAAASAHGFDLDVEAHPVGGAGLDAAGTPLPGATREACTSADAVLLGAVGGPEWADRTGDERPESGLLALRRALGAFANLRPVSVPPALTDASPLRPGVVAGTDILFVRELTGGIYFGTPRGPVEGSGGGAAGGSGERVRNTMAYSEGEVERIARVAFRRAARREGRVASVDKANVLEVSELWRRVASRVADDFPEVELRHLYVDNAAMQVVRDPRQFDVVLTGNLFGDILSDLAAALPGSLGLLPSASVGSDVGLFEPVHGSAPDLAGTGRANPIGTILSGALLLDELGEAEAAAAVRRAVDAALGDGLRTADLAADPADALSTAAFGDAVADRIAASDPVSS
jgi:3-isopropylmalate dehydrogenase